jgi:C1A family cysteine protease
VDQIKQAIFSHGPVSACVYVNSAFQAYTGGIFNACEDEWINHVVLLVGWDDTQGTNGVWILRNSWGYSWGEEGYMRIEYDCSRIGYATCYVEYVTPADCNGNGIPDYEDIASGTSEDCNRNRIPDECDLADGTLHDDDGDGVPDECEAMIRRVNSSDLGRRWYIHANRAWG